ncbi:Xaa-Pro peptidase family protein [Bradyrhizobium sp. LHD-71]|uniref:M24 family metallopeptidase n=1 Tax=Bradyrhizobium sp. LHD-71 TaxID=3072141 RepID=UPI00280CA8C6|nr:Xaa-Pro peptidase family protein [Bradyrhizobium sp. LHD-71]MDQ8732324.1 Xaa-Pro peptidase family protein [Bradyrhizobium sp. LHD-71]
MSFEMQGIRKSRVAQFKQLMQKHGLRAIVISGNENFQFFTNIQLSLHYWERPFALVIPADGEPFALINMVSENGVLMQVERQISWISNLSFYSEVPRMQDRTYTQGQFTRMLQEKLEAAGLDAGPIGYDSKTPHLAELQVLLPRISLIGVSAELKKLRWTKHPEEIAVLQAAATLGDWAMNKVRDNLKPGRGLQELSAHVTALVMAEAGRRYPGSNFQVLKLLTLSGPASSSTDGDGAPTGATVDANAPIVSVIVPRMNGYSVEVHRTYFCGKPNLEQKALFQTALELNESAISQAYATNRVSKIDEVVHAAALKAGHYDYLVHRAGHGIGISTHEYPEDVPVNPRSIEENEVFSLEPGLYVKGLGGFRIGDVVVAKSKPSVITSAPKSLADCVIN